ncbi:hypothetical protein [Streptomyces mirabilis]
MRRFSQGVAALAAVTALSVTPAQAHGGPRALGRPRWPTSG